VLVGVEDVALRLGEEAADRGDQTGPVGAGEEQARGRRLAVDARIIAFGGDGSPAVALLSAMRW